MPTGFAHAEPLGTNSASPLHRALMQKRAAIWQTSGLPPRATSNAGSRMTIGSLDVMDQTPHSPTVDISLGKSELTSVDEEDIFASIEAITK